MQRIMKNFALSALIFLISAPAWANISCTGTEPFWSLQIQPNGISYTDPLNLDRVEYVPVEARGAMGTSPDYVRVYQTRTADRAARPMTVVMTKNDQCSDGMSEEAYSYQVTVVLEDAVLTGCCK
jgi:uncharacterized membrane protein